MNNKNSGPKTDPEKLKFIFDFLETIWKPLSFVLGIVSVSYSFIQSFLGDNRVITWIIAGVGFLLILIVLLVLAFAKESYETKIYPRKLVTQPMFPKLSKPARIGLWILSAFVLISSVLFYYNYQRQEKKFVVVVANFSGEENLTDSVTGKIILHLRKVFPEDRQDVKVITPNVFISEQKGSIEATQLGESYQADLVIWGWYEKNDTNTLVTVHIENLTDTNLLPLASSEVREYRPEIIAFDRFTFHEQISSEMTSLVLFVDSMYFYQVRDYYKSIDLLSQAIEVGSTDDKFVAKEILFDYRGSLYLTLGNYLSAVKDYEQAIAINPDYPGAYIGYGVANLLYGKNKEAIELFSTAILLDSSNPTSFFDRGVAYSSIGQYDLAESDLSEAIRLNSNYSHAYAQRAVVYLEVKRLDAAMQDVNLSLNISDDDAESFNVRGLIKAAQGDLDGAIKDYDSALFLAPNSYKFLFNRGNAYARLGDYLSAISDYSTAIDLNPKHVNSYYSRGFTYFELSKTMDGVEKCDGLMWAIYDYGKAIDLESAPGHFYNRAKVYEAMGNEKLIISHSQGDAGYGANTFGDDSGYGSGFNDDGGELFCIYDEVNFSLSFNKAIQDYSEVLSMDPNDVKSYFGRGYGYLKTGNNSEAAKDFSSVLIYTPNDVVALQNRGLAYFRMDQFEDAFRDFNKAIELQSEFDGAYYNRAFLYIKMDEKDKAILDFQKVIQINRSPELIDESKNQLRKLGVENLE